jgi:hypothetical protein
VTISVEAALRSDRLMAWNEMRDLCVGVAQEGRCFTPQEQQHWDLVHEEIARLDARIAALHGNEPLRSWRPRSPAGRLPSCVVRILEPGELRALCWPWSGWPRRPLAAGKP